MSGFHIYSHHSLTYLAEQLAGLIESREHAPMQTLHVVVPSRACSTWLKRFFIRRWGILANVNMVLPRQWMEELAPMLDDAGLPEEDGFRILPLTWTLVNSREWWEAQPAMEPLLNSWGGSLSDRDWWRFCHAQAQRFDGYMTYRMDWLFRWEQEQGVMDSPAERANELMQAAWWRYVREQISHEPFSMRLRRNVRKAVDGYVPGPVRQTLDRGVYWFGVGMLAPLYADVLGGLGAMTDVHVLIQNPSESFWFDVTQLPLGEDGYLGQDASVLAESESVHPALQRWGQSGAPLLERFWGFDHGQWSDPPELEESTHQDTLLHQLQSHIHLGEQGVLTSATSGVVDSSIRLCSAPSLKRECEGLRDYLLHQFDTHPDLKPEDVLVLSPYMTQYQPYLESCFSQVDNGVALPYSLAESEALGDHAFVRTWLQLLRIEQARLTPHDVATLWQLPSLRRRFGGAHLSAHELTQCLSSSGVRWGLDASFRSQHGAPAIDVASWERGLQRVLVAWSMGESERFGDIVGRAPTSFQLDDVLGALLAWLQGMQQWIRNTRQPRSYAQWAETLRDSLDLFFVEDNDTQMIRSQCLQLLADWGSVRETTDVDISNELSGAEVGLTEALDALEQCIASHEGGHRFLLGGITLASLRPQRVIPAKVIAVLGMDEQSFPRRSASDVMDLREYKPRRGDRRTAVDDGYALLEVILNAETSLWLSYCHTDPQRHTPREASQPWRLFRQLLGDQAGLCDVSMTERGYDPDNYAPGAATSFHHGRFVQSQATLQAAASSAERRPQVGEAPWVVSSLTIDTPQALDLTTWLRFWQSPVAFFAREHLGLRFDRVGEEEIEPVMTTIGGLSGYAAAQYALEALIKQTDVDQVKHDLSDLDTIPVGGLGDAQFESWIEERIAPVADRVSTLCEGDNGDGGGSDTVDIDVALNGLTVTGQTSVVAGDGLKRVHYRGGVIRPKDIWLAWQEHVLLQLSGHGVHSHVVGWASRSGKYTLVDHVFPPGLESIENIEAVGRDLVETLRDGWVSPLPFFVNTSHAFATHMLQGDKQEALRKAYGAFIGDRYQRVTGESSLAEVKICFGTNPQLSPSFERYAERLWTPVLEAMS